VATVEDPGSVLREKACPGNIPIVIDFFKPNVSYYLWSADDPAPFFKDLSNMLLRRG